MVFAKPPGSSTSTCTASCASKVTPKRCQTRACTSSPTMVTSPSWLWLSMTSFTLPPADPSLMISLPRWPRLTRSRTLASRHSWSVCALLFPPPASAWTRLTTSSSSPPTLISSKPLQSTARPRFTAVWAPPPPAILSPWTPQSAHISLLSAASSGSSSPAPISLPSSAERASIPSPPR